MDQYSPKEEEDESRDVDDAPKSKKTHFEEFVDSYIRQLDATEKDERAGCCYNDCCDGQCIEDPARCWCILSPLVIIAPIALAICY